MRSPRLRSFLGIAAITFGAMHCSPAPRPTNSARVVSSPEPAPPPLGSVSPPSVEPARCEGPTFDLNDEAGEGPLWKLATDGAKSSTCGSPSKHLTGSRPSGAKCKHPIDCVPVCCACPTPGRRAWASWCRDGKCASAAETCCAVAGSITNSCSS